VRLTEVPSLDLYREPDPFRIPRLSEIHDRIDLLELLSTWTAAFPEPKTFCLRMARILAERRDEFDVVHDNQSLGDGLLKIVATGLPVVATVHHPITRDRVVDVAAAKWWRKPLVRRWYGFAEMQKRVARRIPELLTVSSTSAADIAADFGVSLDQLQVVPLGVDTELFKPAGDRVRNRIIAIASADVPLKGVSHLLHAVARLRVERDLDVQLVSKLEPNGPTEKLIAELGISDIVHSSSGLSDAALASLLASAEVACIPSLYEGFSLPAVEAMASGTPIVASRAGALPEVLGPDGECARLVNPGDVDDLQCRSHALDQHFESVCFHALPVVERITPKLARTAEVVGRHAGDDERAAVLVQLELIRIGPDVRRVLGHEDRQVADDLDAALVAVVL
jgi:glycosyltransferase involved in cell wall biosynthesis